MPVGIIEQSTEDGAIFKLTRPGRPHHLSESTHRVMVWNAHWDQDEILSGVMIRGQVTEIGPTTATFKVRSKSNTRPLLAERRGSPSRRAASSTLPGPTSFEIDRSQIATPDEEKFLQKMEMDRQLKEVGRRNDSGTP